MEQTTEPTTSMTFSLPELRSVLGALVDSASLARQYGYHELEHRQQRLEDRVRTALSGMRP